MTEYEKDRCIARAERFEAICKTLRCSSSGNDEKDCYADIYNDSHKCDPTYPTMICGEAEGFTTCPYYQEEYAGKKGFNEAVKNAADIIENLLRFS